MKAGDVEDYLDQYLCLLDDIDLYRKLGKKAETFVEWDHITQYIKGRKLWSIIKHVIKRVLGK